MSYTPARTSPQTFFLRLLYALERMGFIQNVSQPYGYVSTLSRFLMFLACMGRHPYQHLFILALVACHSPPDKSGIFWQKKDSNPKWVVDGE